MFFTRLRSSIVLVILAVGGIAAGGPVWAGMLCVISMIAYIELTRATSVHTEGKKFNVLEIAGLIMTVIYYVCLYLTFKLFDLFVLVDVTACTILYVPAFMLIYVCQFPNYKAGQLMEAYFEFIYAPILLSFLFLIRGTWGPYMLGLVFLCSWGSDTCAYCAGILFGKHKMTPRLSPKKTIEGAIGGIAGAALLFALYIHYIVNVYSGYKITLSFVAAMIFGALGAVVSMIGDLAASAIKRDYNIKDYGKLIPGHGGIMDRFDSVIIVTPFIYFYLLFLNIFIGF